MIDVHKEILALRKRVKEVEEELEFIRDEQIEVAKDTVHQMIDKEEIRLGADNDGSVRIISDLEQERYNYEDKDD